jgi:nanoRNase/pAp phosphatase (c-di-AMP/oligoRNAs hydrolase)
MEALVQTECRVDELLRLLRGRERILVMSHNSPDPDSMGAACGMRYLIEKMLGIPTIFGFRGDIFRAENQEMVRALGLGMVKIEELDIDRFDGFVLVDTQPGFGHTVVPEGKSIDGVIDHHVLPENAPLIGHYRDVRTHVGATCSIIADYLMHLELPIPERVATALLYGIKTDTADLSRNSSPLDERVYMHLLGLADRHALARISQPQLPIDYFRIFRKALNAARIYGSVVLCSLGRTENPETVAELADLLLRMQDVEWVVCGGLFEDTYYLSVRAKSYGRDAWSLLHEALKGEGSFGGHGTVGGASIPVTDDSQRGLRRLERRLQNSILEVLGEQDSPGVSLA